jgi:hypothetical protein
VHDYLATRQTHGLERSCYTRSFLAGKNFLELTEGVTGKTHLSVVDCVVHDNSNDAEEEELKTPEP